MIIMKHDGPYYVENGILMNTMTGNSIPNPAIIIDDDDAEMPVAIKIGDASFVEKYFNTMISRCNIYHADQFANALKFVKIDTTALSLDEIATVFNAIMQCTGHPVTHAICCMDTNIASVKDHIQSLQRAGY